MAPTATQPATLLCIQPGSSGLTNFKVLTLYKTKVDIGRAVDCEIQLNSIDLDQYHAILSFRDGTWLVNDLRAPAGIYVDDNRVTAGSAMRLSTGNILKLADIEFLFHHGSQNQLSQYLVDAAVETLKSQCFETFSGSKCSICQDFPIRPVVLNCADVFCKYCIIMWLNSAQLDSEGNNNQCPNCKEEIRTRKPIPFVEHLIESYLKLHLDSEQLEQRRSESSRRQTKEEPLIRQIKSNSSSNGRSYSSSESQPNHSIGELQPVSTEQNEDQDNQSSEEEESPAPPQVRRGRHMRHSDHSRPYPYQRHWSPY